MPLPNPHNLMVVHLNTDSPSVGASPQTVYLRAPFRARVVSFYGILRGALSTSDTTVTVAANGSTIGTFAVPQSGSAAGQLFSGQPQTLQQSYINQGDVISFTPSGGGGANVGMDFQLAIKVA